MLSSSFPWKKLADKKRANERKMMQREVLFNFARCVARRTVLSRAVRKVVLETLGIKGSGGIARNVNPIVSNDVIINPKKLTTLHGYPRYQR